MDDLTRKEFSLSAMKAKALLVYDYPEIRDALGHLLRLEGYDITLASSGREALNALRDTGFDLVLLDLEMPAVNGWDTLVQMVTISLSLPVIITTGRSDQQWLAAQKGVAAVLEKPVDLPLLLDVMKRVLAETAEARRQRIEPAHFAPAQSSDIP
jgi:DNA-binding NtrC family response regulator